MLYLIVFIIPNYNYTNLILHLCDVVIISTGCDLYLLKCKISLGYELFSYFEGERLTNSYAKPRENF